MKCVCIKRCGKRDQHNRAVYYRPGQVAEFDECPSSFRPLEGEDALPLDFDTASEDELMEAEYDIDTLKDYIFKTYEIRAGNRGKEKTVALLLDSRYRSLDHDPNMTI